MLHQTRAIVLKTTKYSDNSLIVKLYTEAFGLQTYIIGGVHGKKAKTKSALFMPLSLLDVVANSTNKSTLIRPKEISVSQSLQRIHADINKSTIAIFLNEILLKSIKEEEANSELFEYIFNSILLLEHTESVASFHTEFLLKLTQFLGFYPQGKHSVHTPYFSMKDGVFTGQTGNDILDENTSKNLYETLNKLPLSNSSKEGRRLLLEKIVQFYAIHIPGFGKPKSLEILQEISA
jgi:DNA repair protein RecO (recombination protein O)